MAPVQRPQAALPEPLRPLGAGSLLPQTQATLLAAATLGAADELVLRERVAERLDGGSPPVSSTSSSTSSTVTRGP